MDVAATPLVALVVAGGSGSRFGSAVPKQFLALAGVPVFVHTVRRFLDFAPHLRVVVVLPQAHLPTGQALLQQHLTSSMLARVRGTTGGATRTASVTAGLREAAHWLPKAEHAQALVAVQDAVRPFAHHPMLQASFASASQHGSGVAAVPSKSSLRRRTPTGSLAVDRSEYFAVQTPQTFRLPELLTACLAPPPGEFTDDASLMEAAGHNIHLVPGGYDNIKITTPEDLILAELFLSGQMTSAPQ